MLDFGFRDYQPHIGRFTTLDPLRDGLNWYALCGNDPINYIDLLGLCKEKKFIDLGLPEMKTLEIIPTIPTIPYNGKDDDWGKAIINGVIGIPNTILNLTNDALDNGNYILKNEPDAFVIKRVEDAVNTTANTAKTTWDYLSDTSPQQMANDALKEITKPETLEKAVTIAGTIVLGEIIGSGVGKAKGTGGMLAVKRRG